MIYAFLKLLFKATVRLFFRNYEVKEAQQIPAQGPLLVVSNHPSTFMDPIVIATTVSREVHFIAKAEAFKTRIAKRLLPLFNMIPVYRKQDDPSLMHKNQDTFIRVFELLERNGCVLIFPEGVSLSDRKLKEIKTGAARMALGVEARNNFTLGVKILPVGLTYTDQHRFQSDLLVRIGDPISTSDFAELYRINEKKAAQQLTEEIRQRIESLVIDIQNQEVDVFVKKVESVYKSQLLHDMGFSSRIPEHDFVVTKMISERIHYFIENEPERVQQTREKIDRYERTLNRLHIEDHIVRGNRRRVPVVLTFLITALYFILGFPLFVFGALNNFIPYKLPYQLARKMKADPQFVGAIMMVSGTFIFLFFYIFQVVLVQHFFNDVRISLVYLLLLPVSGIFAYRYWKNFVTVRRKWVFVSLFLRRNRLAAELIGLRTEIIADLEKGRKDYEKHFPPAHSH